MHMRIPEIRTKGINTTGLTGIVLMTLHILGHLNGWAWPILICHIDNEWYRTRVL